MAREEKCNWRYAREAAGICVGAGVRLIYKETTNIEAAKVVSF